MKTAIQEKPEELQSEQSKKIQAQQHLNSTETSQRPQEWGGLNPFSEWQENPFDPEDLEGLVLVKPAVNPVNPNVEDLVDNPPPAKPPKTLQQILLSPQVGISFLVLFGCVYTLTRPCVIGECPVIDNARLLSEQSQKTIKTVTSSQAPGLAKQQVDTAIKQLKRIPFWSPYHREARALLVVYRQDAQELNAVVKSLRMAGLAAQEVQNPPFEVAEWTKIKSRWEGAIAQLEPIPSNSIIYPFAQQRLEQYRENLAEVRGRLALEREAETTLQTAKKTAKIAQARQGVAKGAESWELVYDTWQSAANTLASIPERTTAHQDAQVLLARYQPQLEAARDRKIIEQVGQDAYTRAVNNAEQAKIFGERGTWSEAVKSWSRAMTYAKRVPQSSSYHVQMQALMPGYTQTWKQAEAQNKVTSRVNAARQALSKACNGACNFSVSGELITIRLTPNYVNGVKTTTTNADRSGNAQKRTETENRVKTLIVALQSISDNAKIPLEVYQPDGKKIGVHIPQQ